MTTKPLLCMMPTYLCGEASWIQIFYVGNLLLWIPLYFVSICSYLASWALFLIGGINLNMQIHDFLPF